MATTLPQQFDKLVSNTYEDETLIKVLQSTGERLLQLTALKTALAAVAPSVNVLQETHTAASFTDGGAAVGTKTMTGSIPAGALILNAKVLVPAGFAGNVSATLTIGDGSDVDRYNTGTPSVFATAATGVEVGVPSGAKLQIAAVQPVLTVTGNSDYTLILAGGGSVTVAIYYILT
jgi:hypothetical protein